MHLHSIKPASGSVKKRKRVGRGTGSGRGKTATRGHKGAKSRSGYSRKLGFEGGQMPLQRRVPKFGFRNPNRVAYKAVNLGDLQKLSEKLNVKVIDPEILRQNGLLGKKDLVKILGQGEFNAQLEVKANAFSKSAKETIEQCGGSVLVIE